MPVRSLHSAVFKWPDRKQVLAAAQRWAHRLRQDRPGVRQVLCVGSYARNDWGVGSDVDLIVIVGRSDRPAWERSAGYETNELPVQADVWVYTALEWADLAQQRPHLWRRLQAEWLDLSQ